MARITSLKPIILLYLGSIIALGCGRVTQGEGPVLFSQPTTSSVGLTARPTVTLQPSATPQRMTISTLPPGEANPIESPSETLPGESTGSSTQTDPASGPVKVMWDTSHGPRQGQDGEYSVTGIYGNLADLLSPYQIELEDNRSAIGTCELAEYAAIAVAATSAFSISFTSEEAVCVRNYVENGGGLVILGERPEFPNRLRTLTDAFGLALFEAPQIGELSSWNEHPIFENVSRIVFEQGGSVSILGSEMELVGYSGGNGAIAIFDADPIRVVAIGDSNLFDDRWLVNNHVLAVNIFHWVTE